ncbi:hypothetical protein KFL_004480100 [Klebsormidium nitens]|uniref:Uncharacterized protein n=1 Tax=Klebsormidium nitens TaxID=105231 RepID=A0A1Y1IDI3_KLENI|nr:hypothetical protein KFL_004480100 [Klebsormidium nitens]|eukprot:GAQ88653.1 hypothetical protein KFL_004480100 [Klebsormidium nitens]
MERNAPGSKTSIAVRLLEGWEPPQAERRCSSGAHRVAAEEESTWRSSVDGHSQKYGVTWPDLTRILLAGDSGRPAKVLPRNESGARWKRWLSGDEAGDTDAGRRGPLLRTTVENHVCERPGPWLAAKPGVRNKCKAEVVEKRVERIGLATGVICLMMKALAKQEPERFVDPGGFLIDSGRFLV